MKRMRRGTLPSTGSITQEMMRNDSRESGKRARPSPATSTGTGMNERGKRRDMCWNAVGVHGPLILDGKLSRPRAVRPASREQGEDWGSRLRWVQREHRRRYKPPLKWGTLAPEAVCCNFGKINRGGGIGSRGRGWRRKQTEEEYEEVCMYERGRWGRI